MIARVHSIKEQNLCTSAKYSGERSRLCVVVRYAHWTVKEIAKIAGLTLDPTLDHGRRYKTVNWGSQHEAER